MNNPKIRDIYISCYLHDKKGETAGRWIAYQAGEAGYTVSIRFWDDLPGNGFIDQMKDAAQFCQRIVAIVSGVSLEAMFPDNKIKKQFIKGATGLEKILTVVRIDDCSMLKVFQKFNYIDLNCAQEKEARVRLFNGISSIHPHPAQTLPSCRANQTKDIPRYTILEKNDYSADKILAIRRGDIQNILSNLLQNNYHMQLQLEMETIKEMEVEDRVTGIISKEELIVWETISLKTILSNPCHYLLINPSGMGKTVFLNYLCLELLSRPDLYQYLPLPWNCLELNFRKSKISISDLLQTEIENFYHNSRTNLIKNDWRNLCLVIDALDQAQNVEEVLQSIKKRIPYKNARIIIALRDHTSFQIPHDFKRIRLKLPEEREIRRYLGDHYLRLEPMIRSSRELATNPMFLKLARTLAINGRLKAHSYNRATLFHEYIQHLINCEKEKPCFFNDSQTIQDFLNFGIEDYLERIAFMALQHNEILEIKKENLAAYGIDPIKQDSLFQMGIFHQLFEERGAKIIFRHQSYQAYFAARFIRHQDRDIFRQLVSNSSSFYHESWHEVIRFYLGLERNPVQITANINLILNSNNEEKHWDLFKGLRLIHAAILISETNPLPINVSEILNDLRGLISEAKENLYLLKINIGRFKMGHLKYHSFLVNSILKPFLQDGDWFVRMTAVEILGQIGTFDDVSLIKPLLHDEDWSVRNMARIALEKIIISYGVPLLRSLLREIDGDIRKIALQALGKIGSSRDIPLLQPLLQDKDRIVKEAAIDSLGIIGTSGDISLIQPLLQDEDWIIRRAAVKAYSKIVVSGDISLLQSLLQDKDADVRKVAAETLSRFRTAGDTYLFQSLLQDKDIGVRRAAAKALGDSNDIILIKSLLRDNDCIIRKMAIETLEKIDTSGDILPLLNSLLLDEDKSVRVTAIKALSKIGPSGDISFLKNLLQNKDLNIRSTAAEALDEFVSPGIRPLLLSLARDKDRIMRRMAMEVLTRIVNPGDIPLLKSLIQDQDWVIRKLAAEALGKTGAANDAPLLYSLLNDEDNSVRKAALVALGRIGTPSDIISIKPFLWDQDMDLRMKAIEVFGKIGGPEALLLLRSLLRDNERLVRAATIDILGKIGASDDIPFLTSFLQDRYLRWKATIALEAILIRTNPVNIKIKELNKHFQPVLRHSIRQHPWHILHISDLHYHKENAMEFQILFNNLVENINNWRQREKNKIDMICITGDLVWSGEEMQYQNLENKIRQLLDISGCTPEYLFIVPGNHDLHDFIKDPPDNEAAFKEIYEEKVDLNRQFLNQYANYEGFLAKLENYRRFLSKVGCRSILWQKIEGEIKPWYAVRIENANLIILGLNSPLFTCQKYHRRGEVKMGSGQFFKACQFIEPRENEQILVLTHHPLEWLDEDEMDELENAMCKKYAIHLFGHKHRRQDLELKTTGDEVMLRLGVGSIYGGGDVNSKSFEIVSINYEDLTVRSSLYVWDSLGKQWEPAARNNFFKLPYAMKKN